MYQIDVISRTPVYEQIIRQTEEFILKGVLKPGDRMPSVRTLSVELSVNPNTIQKAIAELDRRTLIKSVPGKGSFISDNALELMHIAKRTNYRISKRSL
ncbi:transcriptional regulator, GntR family [[Bacteroides] pectinophilus ATCC 43243]|uniref:HTH gntR-type domain-containing protein n=1 Tax=[Bacteroides] pectinophilus ATCC 43243 TaxID=483218 RepID=B7AWA5_9FIRM|nr:transcriptional regulator, GntR family [[Bacteroides] pectinophilus ATCC 43243]